VREFVILKEISRPKKRLDKTMLRSAFSISVYNKRELVRLTSADISVIKDTRQSYRYYWTQV